MPVRLIRPYLSWTFVLKYPFFKKRINDLDMNRIARVDILKDATATSIYGSRAANGVIVIETIRPADGKLRFSYTGSLNVEAPDLTGYDLIKRGRKIRAGNGGRMFLLI